MRLPNTLVLPMMHGALYSATLPVGADGAAEADVELIEIARGVVQDVCPAEPACIAAIEQPSD
jgi:hypothetical protein